MAESLLDDACVIGFLLNHDPDTAPKAEMHRTRSTGCRRSERLAKKVGKAIYGIDETGGFGHTIEL